MNSSDRSFSPDEEDCKLVGDSTRTHGLNLIHKPNVLPGKLFPVTCTGYLKSPIRMRVPNFGKNRLNHHYEMYPQVFQNDLLLY